MDAEYPVPSPYDVPPSIPVNVRAIVDVDGNRNTLYVFTYPEPDSEPVPIIARRLDG